jgi:hypothetical protein
MLRPGLAGPLAALGLLAMLAGPAAAQRMESLYTDLDLDQCSVIEAHDMGATFACPGYKGIPVMVGEGDLRFFVSYGLTSTTERAAEQTLPPFNHLGPRIEWRLSNAEGGWKPVATILRWFTASIDASGNTGKEEGQVLVVTQIRPGATCHIAYVDARANADANALARQAADRLAGDFDCGREPEIVGSFGAY